MIVNFSNFKALTVD